MKNLWILLLLCAVAAAAFFLGQRTGTAPATPLPPAAVTAPAQADAGSNKNSHGEELSSAPPRTFRGPNGLPMMIAYDVGEVPDNNNREKVKAAMLADMKNHPRNIEQSYGLSLGEIKDIAEGRKPFPEILLPKPPATVPANQ